MYEYSYEEYPIPRITSANHVHHVILYVIEDCWDNIYA